MNDVNFKGEHVLRHVTKCYLTRDSIKEEDRLVFFSTSPSVSLIVTFVGPIALSYIL